MIDVRTTKEPTDSVCGGSFSVCSDRMATQARVLLPQQDLGAACNTGGTRYRQRDWFPALEALQRHALLREGV